MPISAFAHALRAFQSGDLTQDELSWEIDRQLAIEKTSPVALMEVLRVQQVAGPLASAAHEAIVSHLEEWPRDPTIVTGLDGAKRVALSPRAGVGDILQGRFSLVALIGEGGMSRVFKAIDLRRVEAAAADPYVAVKVLTEPVSDYFGSIVALQREAHKLQSLSHPNIVRVIDCDRDGHTVFMTMEYLAGESLQKRLRSRAYAALDEAAALALIADVGGALEFAHRNGIVHGDLKPGNIILTERGPKVIDFGMARFIARPGDAVRVEPAAQATPKAVTPRYASPEMVAGRDPEPADDVYALACIAYETLTGRHPFGRTRDAPARASHTLPARPEDMPRHRYLALVKGLAFDRKHRTPSVREFLEQLHGRRGAVPARRWTWLAVAAIGALAVVSYQFIGARRPAPPPVIVAGVVPGAVLHDCPTCPTLRVLPPGSFQQGDAGSEGESRFQRPRHEVALARSFSMSVHEITVADFRAFASATQRDMSGCTVYDGRWQYRHEASWEAPGFAQEASHPVTCVSWDDAVAYAAWLSAASGHRYRLPSASEWEYAARAGSSTPPWAAGSAVACGEANVADASAAQRYPGWQVFACDDHFVNTAPVGSFKANAFGLNDLLGNVFEWVQDCWHEDYGGAPVDGSAWQGGECAERELRGGSWFTAPQYVSPSYRDRFASAYRSSAVGFRLVRELGP